MAHKLNKKTQIRHLEANLRKAKIDPDLIDLEAIVDETLTYRENKKIVFDQVHYAIEHKKISVSEEAANTFYQMKMVQEQRGYSGRYDETRRNKKTITVKQINKNPSKGDKWFKNPGNYDVEGIDSIDKTDSAVKTKTVTSPQGGDPGVESESHSKILKEINMNKEFDKMAEKFKGGGSDAEKEKKYKYKCECGAYFNVPGRDDSGNTVCPDCGK